MLSGRVPGAGARLMIVGDLQSADREFGVAEPYDLAILDVR
jgi:hypothetical protein